MTDAERIVVTMEANVEAFERAVEERFKPALAQAIADVVSEFVEGVIGEVVIMKDEPK